MTSAGCAVHCTCPSAICPLCETSPLRYGSRTLDTCGTDLSVPRPDAIAVLSAGSVTSALPWVANTIVVWPPPKAGSLALRTLDAFCDSVPGMVKLSLVFPPLAWAMAMAATAAASHSARTSLRRRKANWASRYR